MQKDLISVVVPIYKVENYLTKCVNSIINQTYKNLEIILVDDGSPDNCPKMCDDLAKLDPRIRVIHKNNGGLSDARNTGIEFASGKYIAFIDSDDYIHERYIEVLYDNIISTNSDLSICGFKEVFENSPDFSQQPVTISNIEMLSNKQIFNNFYKKGVLFIVAWNKLYKTSLFKDSNIRYPFGKIHEDEFVAHEILNQCKNVCICNTPLYFYLQRPSSIMGQTKTEKNLAIFEALDNRCDFFKTLNKRLYVKSISSFISTLTCVYFEIKKDVKPVVLSVLKNFLVKHKSGVKSISRKMKFKLFLFDHFRLILGFRYKIKYSKRKSI